MKKLLMEIDLSVIGRIKTEVNDNLKPITPEMAENLAETMIDAYKNTVDYEGEEYEDALFEIKNVIADGYGEFLKSVSFAFVKENEVVSAIMVSLYENIPYILYVFTKKNNIGRGLATRLIRKSLYELDRKGYRRVQLSVSEANHGARFLYEKLGFKYKSIS